MVVGNMNFSDFFGANVKAGEGFYKPQQQFVDAAEEVTTEQPTEEEIRQGAGGNPLNPAQQKLVEQGELQYTDLGYPPQGLYSNPGTIEIPGFPGSGQEVPINLPTQTETPIETPIETAPVDTGPTTRELIIQAEQWFLDNSVGLPYSRQDYGSDEEYLNALTGYIDTYQAPVTETTTDTGTTDTTTTGGTTDTTTTTGGTTDTTTTGGPRLDELLGWFQIKFKIHLISKITKQLWAN